MKNNMKKQNQLGMSPGTAANRLRKSIMFDLILKLGLNVCYQCKKEITKETELSIEHKEPYLDSENPKEKFFDLANIAFSHHKCNSGARRSSRIVKHGTSTMYINYKCRCQECLTYRKERYHRIKD